MQFKISDGFFIVRECSDCSNYKVQSSYSVFSAFSKQCQFTVRDKNLEISFLKVTIDGAHYFYIKNLKRLTNHKLNVFSRYIDIYIKIKMLTPTEDMSNSASPMLPT